MTERRKARDGDRGGGRKASPAASQADRSKGAPDIPTLEWIVAGVGFTLVAATLVFLILRGFSDDASPPDIALHAEAVVELQRGYLVPVRAVNRGTRTAGNVKVEGELRSTSAVVETAEATFTYLPARSERRAGLFFSEDPRRYQLVLRPKGFEKP